MLTSNRPSRELSFCLALATSAAERPVSWIRPLWQHPRRILLHFEFIPRKWSLLLGDFGASFKGIDRYGDAKLVFACLFVAKVADTLLCHSLCYTGRDHNGHEYSAHACVLFFLALLQP